MKKIFLIVTMLFVCTSVYSQFTMYENGRVTHETFTGNWVPAYRTYLSAENSCTHNVYNKLTNKDVFYVCAAGFTWNLTGSYRGSDLRFKEDITPIVNPIEKVKALNGVRYRFKKSETSDDGYRFGFIAQEVKEVCPEAVKEMHDGSLAVSYTDFIAILNEAVKEQQNVLETMDKELVRLKEENEVLKQRIEKLEGVK